MTCPIFFAQARSAAGEPGAILGLVLVTIALMRHGAGQSGRGVWGWLLAGLAIGFLAKGLNAFLLLETPYAARLWGMVLAMSLGLVVLAFAESYGTMPSSAVLTPSTARG